jgi:hypothetical protein
MAKGSVLRALARCDSSLVRVHLSEMCTDADSWSALQDVACTGAQQKCLANM